MGRGLFGLADLCYLTQDALVLAHELLGETFDNQQLFLYLVLQGETTEIVPSQWVPLIPQMVKQNLEFHILVTWQNLID